MLEKPLMVHMTIEQELNRIPPLPCILVPVTLFPGNVAHTLYSRDVGIPTNPSIIMHIAYRLFKGPLGNMVNNV